MILGIVVGVCKIAQEICRWFGYGRLFNNRIYTDMCFVCHHWSVCRNRGLCGNTKMGVVVYKRIRYGIWAILIHLP